MVEQRTENPRVAGSIPALGIFLGIAVLLRQFFFIVGGIFSVKFWQSYCHERRNFMGKINMSDRVSQLTGTNVDFILEGVNKYLTALAREQIRLAFAKSEGG